MLTSFAVPALAADFSHDASSPSSQRILSLLQARIKPEGHQASTSDLKSPADEYLKSASSPINIPNAPFELEVVDKRSATSDQWNTIGAYLQKNRRSQVERLKDEDGAIVVDWDGQVLQSEGEVNTFLEQLSSKEVDQKSGSSGCVIV
jgi:hypothetical protein